MQVTTIGLAIAKQVFFVVGMARQGHQVWRNRVRRGRVAAWLGLVPRQYTTGGPLRLYGISKRGEKRLRALLIHGARAVVRHATRKTDPLRRWIRAGQARRGTHLATVALANKVGRMAWGLLTRAASSSPAQAAA